jgi:hypothetical protein
MSNPSLENTVFRWVADNTTEPNEQTGDYLAVQDTSASLSLDTTYRIRWGIQELGSKAANNCTFQLQYDLSTSGSWAGSWTAVSTTATEIRPDSASLLVDGTSSTDLSAVPDFSTGLSGSFIGTNFIDDVDGTCGGTGANIAKSGYGILEYGITLRSAGLSAGNDVRFRVVETGNSYPMTYTQYGYATVTIGDTSQSAKPAKLILRSKQASSTGKLSQSAKPARIIMRANPAQFTGKLSQSAKPAKLVFRSNTGTGVISTEAIDQVAYRFFEDDGDIDSATPIDSENTDIPRYTGTSERVRLRFAIEENGGSDPASQLFWLYYNKNSEGWNRVQSASSVARTTDGTPSDGTTILAANHRLTGGAGTAINGQYDESDGSLTIDLGANTHTELEYCFYIIDADVAHGDTIQFRVEPQTTTNNSWTQVPTLTVSKKQSAKPAKLVLRSVKPDGFSQPIHWRIEEGSGETLTDEYNDIDATSFGGSTVWVDGKTGVGSYAVHVNTTGSNGFVADDHVAFKARNALTVTCWVNVQGSPFSNAPLIRKAHASFPSWSIQHSGVTKSLLGGVWGSDNLAITNASTALLDGKWYLAVLRWQDGESPVLNVYNENGTLYDSVTTATTASGEIRYDSNSLYIGRTAAGGRVDDYLDDIRIYHRKLNDQEIQDLIPVMASPARLILRTGQASSAQLLAQSAKSARIVLRTGQASSTGTLSQSAKPARIVFRTGIGTGVIAGAPISQSASPARLILRTEQASSTGKLLQAASPAKLVLRTGVGTGVHAGAPISQSAKPAKLILRSTQASSTGTLSQSAKPARIVLRTAQASSTGTLSQSAKPAKLILRTGQASSTSTLSQSAKPAKLILRTAQALSIKGLVSQSAKPAKLILRTGIATGVQAGAPQSQAAKPARLILRTQEASSTGTLSQSAKTAKLILRTGQGSPVILGAPISQSAKPSKLVLRATQAASTGTLSQSAKPAKLVLRTATGSGAALFSQSAKPSRLILRTATASSLQRMSAKPARLVLRTASGTGIIGSTGTGRPARLVLRTAQASSVSTLAQSAKPARLIFRTAQASARIGDFSRTIYYVLERAGNYFIATAPPGVFKAVAKIKRWIAK